MQSGKIGGLAKLLDVEQIENDFYRGMATPGGAGRMFGGQALGQSVMAAMRTVPDDRILHSLHAYFIRAGDATAPVLYQIHRDRDGRSFNTRRVVALQNGKPILNLSCSFQVEESGLSHHPDMPDDFPQPDDLPSEAELNERHADKLPERLRHYLMVNRPVELRPCILRAPYDHTPRPPRYGMWFRAKEPLPDDANTHRAALAFASDMGLLAVSMMPHGKGFSDADMQCASLDHALWLHGDLRMDDWLLYATDSPWAGGARGFARGQIFTRDGRLVAETAQEGLIRQVTPR